MVVEDTDQWNSDNNCSAGTGYNTEKTHVTCMCSDGSVCTETDGVKTGCPCSVSWINELYAGLPLWAWIIIGVIISILLLIAQYYIYLAWKKMPNSNKTFKRLRRLRRINGKWKYQFGFL